MSGKGFYHLSVAGRLTLHAANVTIMESSWPGDRGPARSGSRKVRTPKSTMPANGRAG